VHLKVDSDVFIFTLEIQMIFTTSFNLEAKKQFGLHLKNHFCFFFRVFSLPIFDIFWNKEDALKMTPSQSPF